MKQPKDIKFLEHIDKLKDKKLLIGLGAVLLGLLCRLSCSMFYGIEYFGYLLILAGACYLLYAPIKAKARVTLLLIAGAGCFVISAALDFAMRFTYVASPVTILLLFLVGIALIVVSRLKPEQDIDIKALKNIERNRNKGAALRGGALALFGLFLLCFVRDAFAITPLIGAAMLGCGTWLLIKNLSEPDIREDVAYREKDEMLGAEIKKLQAILRILRIVMWFGYAALVVTLIIVASSGSWIPLLIASLVCGSILWTQEHYQTKIKKYVAEHIVREALEAVFAVEEYRPFGHIDHGKITGKYFGISSFDDIHGSDYVRGTYQGLPIELCDMHLTERQTRTNDSGHTEEYNLTVFRGFWLICDFGRELSAELRLWERGKLGKLVGGKGISTDNEKFNRHFHIESEVEAEAFYILTPHMMEYILEMDKKAGGETHMRFDRDGKVQIAISTGRDGFEIGKQAKDATKLRKQFIAEIRYITDIIDELRLVDTLYKS